MLRLASGADQRRHAHSPRGPATVANGGRRTVVALDEREMQSVVMPVTACSTLAHDNAFRPTRRKRAPTTIAVDALTWSVVWSVTLWVGLGPESGDRALETAALTATVVLGS